MTAITSGRVTIPVWRVIRAAWFRSRLTLTVLLAAFAATAGWTLFQAVSMRSWLAAHHVQQCATPALHGIGSACDSASDWIQFVYGDVFQADYVIFALLGAPVVLAVFGGVRWLTREYETGSFRYTWTLGVSRMRWLAGTLLPLLAVVLAGAVACGLAYDRWSPAGLWLGNGYPSGVEWGYNEFPFTPLTFTALVLAGFGIAACAAAFIQRTVPAMAVTAAAVGGGAYLADTRLRTWLITRHPVTVRGLYGTNSPGWPYSYVLHGWVTDHAGHTVPGLLVTPGGGMTISGQLGNVFLSDSAASQRAWLAAHHYTAWITYQPHSRLLILQAAWAGILLAVAIAAFALTIWRVTASR
jgi:hypothetical protein